MAPVQSMKKQTAARKSASGKSAISSKPVTFEDFRNSKRDKRSIKHASFVSKIEKNAKKPHKTRRSSKKLAANLDSLADALPDTETELNDPGIQTNIIKQKTLRHKPGAMKRKQQIENMERDRFGKNMAQLSNLDSISTADPDASAEQGSTSNRWAALRNFVSQTMEQQPVFQNNS